MRFILAQPPTPAAQSTLGLAWVVGGVAGGVVPPTPVPGANTGNAFRYDLDTRVLPEGEWELVATFDDGARATTRIRLRRLAWLPAVLHLLLKP
ncbi:MAG: hypothetical protein AB1578_18890 [Thermodesulfobacteriota bacterium]